MAVHQLTRLSRLILIAVDDGMRQCRTIDPPPLVAAAVPRVTVPGLSFLRLPSLVFAVPDVVK